SQSELGLKHIASCGVAARLEKSPELLLRILDPERSQRLANRRGMMPEIVYYSHSSRDATHFHSALDSFEGVECRLNVMVFQAAMFRAGDYRQSIANIQFADKVRVELKAGDLEFRCSWSVANVEGMDRVLLAETETFHGAMRDVEQRTQVGIISVGQQQTVP